MKTTVVLFNQALPSSFIHNALSAESLQSLRVGKKTYGELIENFECLQNSEWVYTQTTQPASPAETFNQVLEAIKNHSASIQQEDKILIYDMNFYPLAQTWAEHLFAKAVATDVPLLVFTESPNQPELIASCLTYEQLQNHQLLAQEFEPAIVHANASQFANLADTNTVLRLFSSGFSLRHFNSLQLSRNVFFLKTSHNTQKMKAEYNFFSNLPAPVRPYFPQVGDITVTTENTGYEIEIIPLLDVAKLLFNNVFYNSAHAHTLVNLLDNYLQACPVKKVSNDTYKNVTSQHFVEKTKKRLEETLKLPCIEQMNEVCRLNGFDSLDSFATAYMHEVEKDIQSSKETSLVFSHGDLFFSNILFDPIRNYIKLIDPKGHQNEDELAGYLPAWYDLAKLSHSFLGHYDLMVYDLMDIVMQPDLTLGLKSAELSGLQLLREGFIQFLKKRKISLKQLRLYEGTLFLSMLPLHADDPLRIQRQLIRSIELLRFATSANK